MKNLNSIVSTLTTVVILFGSAAVIDAQPTRTWVSGVGDDANPCSRTAPCKTFAGAISKTAKDGEINCLDDGGFGAVTLTKSITLDCSGEQGGILAALTTGIVINITDTADVRKAVRIRGLNINGASTGINGIRVAKAMSVSIENTVIDGFTGSAVSVEDATSVFISNVTVRYNATGITAGAGSTVRLFGDRIYGNKVGLLVKGGSIVSFKNNIIAGNDTDGAPTSSANQQ